MSETEKKDVTGLDRSLEGYKEKIPLVNKSTITWEKELIFHGRTQRGEEIDYDAEFQWGCSPTETLLLSIGGCLAIDVVSFLQKMRCEISTFRMDLSGKRKPDPPQYYKSVELVMHISGENITEKKIERAISLSQDKYCSVYHSLRPDIEVEVIYHIE
ncbi:MAG: OsmC family protein [Nitrospiraceae bacterium]|nr:MAG: OsmC family protein [Nitrospiraceae bacterium]